MTHQMKYVSIEAFMRIMGCSGKLKMVEMARGQVFFDFEDDE